MRLCLMLLAAITLTASGTNLRADEGAKDAALRVMTFNIRYGTARDGENHWDKRREFLVDVIRDFGPDLLGTQENLTFQADFIEKNLEGYTCVGAGRDDGLGKGEMAAIFFRSGRFQLLDSGNFWLSETPDVPGSKSWDAALTRIVTWVKLRDRQTPEQGPLYFFNTHFDHMGKEARVHSAELLHQRIAALEGSPRVIATGDFNEGEGSRPYQAFFPASAEGKLVLIDAYRAANPVKQGDETSFNGFDAKAEKGSRIDWIACTKQFRVESAEIVRTSRDGHVPSDHFPVTAVLSPAP
jgi:endonuclease/exonuclease/phosphatase family metal-dependent hydrolase